MSPQTLAALERAITVLKRDPARAVSLRVDDLDLELRVAAPSPRAASAADFFQEIGPWEGETTEEILELLGEARRQGRARPVGRL